MYVVYYLTVISVIIPHHMFFDRKTVFSVFNKIIIKSLLLFEFVLHLLHLGSAIPVVLHELKPGSQYNAGAMSVVSITGKSIFFH